MQILIALTILLKDCQVSYLGLLSYFMASLLFKYPTQPVCLNGEPEKASGEKSVNHELFFSGEVAFIRT